MERRSFLGGVAGSVVAHRSAGAAALDRPLRLVIMNSMNDTYSSGGGLGSVACLQMAVEDMNGTVAGVPIEVIAVDHGNKSDIAVSRALELFDKSGVDAMFDIGNSAISLALQEIARTRGKVVIHVGSAHDALYGSKCSPTGALWTYDTYSLARGLTKAIYDRGGTRWFFITADYAFGEQMQARSTEVLRSLGGSVVGSVKHPLGATDFSSYLVQAIASGATTVALVSAGADTVNGAKQASEFGIGKGANTQHLAAPIFYLTAAHEIGADGIGGLQFLTAFYWDRDDGSRALGRRFAARRNGAYPNQAQMGNYSAGLHYLRAVQATGSRDGLTVMRHMKATPVDDPFAQGARLREDGRLMHGYYLTEVKKASEVKQGWDMLKLLNEVPASQIVRPVAEGGCPYLDPA